MFDVAATDSDESTRLFAVWEGHLVAHFSILVDYGATVPRFAVD